MLTKPLLTFLYSLAIGSGFIWSILEKSGDSSEFIQADVSEGNENLFPSDPEFSSNVLFESYKKSRDEVLKQLVETGLGSEINVRNGEPNYSLCLLGVRDAYLSYLSGLRPTNGLLWYRENAAVVNKMLGRHFFLMMVKEYANSDIFELTNAVSVLPVFLRESCYNVILNCIAQIDEPGMVAALTTLSEHPDSRADKLLRFWEIALENPNKALDDVKLPTWQRETMLRELGRYLASRGKNAVGWAEGIENSRDRWSALAGVFGNLMKSDPANAADQFVKIRGWERQRDLAKDLVGYWALEDFDAAEAWVRSSTGNSRLAATSRKALIDAASSSGDEKEASRLSRELANEYREKYRWNKVDSTFDVNTLISDFSKVSSPLGTEDASFITSLDRDSVVKAVASDDFPIDRKLALAAGLLVHDFNDLGSTEIANVVRSLPEAVQSGATAGLINFVSLSDPAEAAQLLPLVGHNSLNYDQAHRSVGYGYGRSNSEEGLEWLDSLASSERIAGVEGLIRGWSETDPIDASEWMATQNVSDIARAIPWLVRSIASTDPQAAIKWVQALPSRDEQLSILRANISSGSVDRATFLQAIEDYAPGMYSILNGQ